MTNFRKCCVSLPLRVPLSALSFIPHKHMRYGAVLMRTEWTDPRPQRHRGPPPQIHRRYQFSGVLFKRPQCGIQNTSVLCSAIPHKFPQKLLLCLFFSAVTSQNCWRSFLLHVHCRIVSDACLLKKRSWNCWQCRALFSYCTMDNNTGIPFDEFFPAWCMRAFTRPLTVLAKPRPTADHIKVTAGNHEMKERWHVEETWTHMQTVKKHRVTVLYIPPLNRIVAWKTWTGFVVFNWHTLTFLLPVVRLIPWYRFRREFWRSIFSDIVELDGTWLWWSKCVRFSFFFFYFTLSLGAM